MPIYIYKHPEKNEHIEVVQKMSDFHIYIDYDGLEWERVFTTPTTSIGLRSDVDSERQFVDKTKGWTTGDMWDYSKELSEKRKAKRGDDHVERAYDKKKTEEKKKKQDLHKKNATSRSKKPPK